MAITVNLRYKGENGNALKFAEEMMASGTVAAIRAEAGNLRYEYYQSLEDPETVLLIDSWESQEAIDIHHASPMMATLAALRDKYDLHMTADRYTDLEAYEAELLDAALAARPRKVVIKRPPKGPYLAGKKPSYSLTGKAVRYDVIAL